MSSKDSKNINDALLFIWQDCITTCESLSTFGNAVTSIDITVGEIDKAVIFRTSSRRSLSRSNIFVKYYLII